MSRFGAFLVHLGISLVIFAVLAWIILSYWYPDFFFASDGGWQGIRIIAFVDLVLGPTLTLIVFNKKKPTAELRRDLSVIATFQAACLIAGTYIVYAERPLALVYVDGQFFSMSRDDYVDVGVDVPDFETIPGPYPKRVVVDLPENPIKQSEIRRQALQNRKPLSTLSSYYVPYAYERLDADAEALGPRWLSERERQTGDLSAWVEEHGGELKDYAFFKLGARYGYLVLGVDRRDGQVVGLLNTELGRLPAKQPH